MRFFLVICVLSLMQMTFAIDVKYDILTNIPAPGYISSALNLETKTPGILITEFTGEHLPGKKDSDVILFDITEQKTDYLPRGLSAKYVNMEILHVMNSGVKSIARSDFTAMSKLKELALFSNKLEVIPVNCFDDLILMAQLSLTKNNIKTLPPKVFHALPDLKAVYLSQNQLTAIPADLFEKNLKLEYISFRENQLMLIGSNILTNLNNLKNVNFKENVCIDDSYPRNSIANLVSTIKSQCNVMCDAKEIARLQGINQNLAEQQRANDKTINGIRANCPSIPVLSPSAVILPSAPPKPSPIPSLVPVSPITVSPIPVSPITVSPIPVSPIPVSASSQSDLQKKYDQLKKSYEELATSKDCNYKVHNGATEIELIFHHNG
ncbi:unnamed protein product [Diamesa hyperborea]